VLGVIAFVLLIAYLLAGMFGPMPRYDIRDANVPWRNALAPISTRIFANASGSPSRTGVVVL
jgi:hypothetical protein